MYKMLLIATSLTSFLMVNSLACAMQEDNLNKLAINQTKKKKWKTNKEALTQEQKELKKKDRWAVTPESSLPPKLPSIYDIEEKKLKDKQLMQSFPSQKDQKAVDPQLLAPRKKPSNSLLRHMDELDEIIEQLKARALGAPYQRRGPPIRIN